jgi:hypothetical protein
VQVLRFVRALMGILQECYQSFVQPEKEKA